MAFVDSVDVQVGGQRSRFPLLNIWLHPAAGSSPVKEELAFKTQNASWSAHTASLAEKYAQLATSEGFRPEPPTAAQAVQQVQELRGLEALNAAQDLLQACMQANPFIQGEPGAQELLKTMRDTRLSMRLAAGIFGIVVLLMVGLATQGQARLGCGTIFAVIAIVDLLLGKSSGRKLALIMGLATAGLNIALNLFAGSLLDIVAWASFGLAMLLLLTGNPSRQRIAASGAVFVVGTLGTIAFVMLGALYFPKTLNAFIPGANEPYVDDFSKDQKWVQNQTDDVAMSLEDGSYSIQLKQPDLTYFSFPPVAFFPVRGEVDVRLPGDSLDPNTGLYGLICRYQEDPEKYYAVYIDPLMEEFAIIRYEEDKDDVPLTDPVMQALRGLKKASQLNLIGLSCQDNLITLKINGTQQAQVSDPQMAQFGEGEMALMVAAYEDIPAGGFKVLFDNASFWP